MASVALVGGDGAGKSSIARELVSLSEGKARYVYMGMNPDSSNFSLPTTKIMFAVKKRKAGADNGRPVSLHTLESRKVERGKLFSALRLLNRIAEESVRQLISWGHQAAGRVVIYDRHFLFDYWPTPTGSSHGLADRVHLWFLRRIYPKPGLVIFLDAPSEVLLARKQEVPAGYLEKRRAAVRDAGRFIRRFEVVDASRPFDQVLGSVLVLVGDVMSGLVRPMDGGRR